MSWYYYCVLAFLLRVLYRSHISFFVLLLLLLPFFLPLLSSFFTLRSVLQAEDDASRRVRDIQARLDAETELSQQLQHELEVDRDKKVKLKAALSEAGAELELLRREHTKLTQQLAQKNAYLDDVQAQIDQAHQLFRQKEVQLTDDRKRATDAFLRLEGQLKAACQELDKTTAVLQDTRHERDQARTQLKNATVQVDITTEIVLDERKRS